MLKYKNNPDLSLLPQIFSEFADIRAVYIFGSTGTKTVNRQSDLDLAVLSDSRDSGRQRMKILTALTAKGFCNVDLVFLDTKDIVLKYEAVSPNRLIYQRKDFERGVYYSKIIRQYLDFLPYLNVQRKAYKRRILNG